MASSRKRQQKFQAVARPYLKRVLKEHQSTCKKLQACAKALLLVIDVQEGKKYGCSLLPIVQKRGESAESSMTFME